MTDFEIVESFMHSNSEEKQEILKTHLGSMSPLGKTAIYQESVIFELREENERLRAILKDKL